MLCPRPTCNTALQSYCQSPRLDAGAHFSTRRAPAWQPCGFCDSTPRSIRIGSDSGALEAPEVARLRSAGPALIERHGLAATIVDRITRYRSAYWEYLDTGVGYEKLVAELGDLKQKPWYPVSRLPRRVRLPTEREDLPEELQRFLDSRQMDPLATLSGSENPILAVYGRHDDSMPAAEFAVKLHFLAGALEMNLTIRTLAHLGHELSRTDSDPQIGKQIDGNALLEMVQWSLQAQSLRSSRGISRSPRGRDSAPPTGHPPPDP